MYKLVLISIFVIFVSGCAGQKTIEGITTPNKSESAIVLGQGSDVGNFFSFLTTPIAGSRYDSYINEIDGKKVSATNGDREWWILPGDHLLNITCTLSYGGIDNTEESDIKVTVVKGHTYQIIARPTDKACVIKLNDVTGHVSN